MIPAVAVPIVVGSMAISGTAFAKSKGPKPQVITCTGLSGATDQNNVRVSGCSSKNGTLESGGSGLFTVFQLTGTTSTGNVIDWSNGATVTYSLSAAATVAGSSKDKCPGGSSANGPIMVKLTGSVTGQTIPPSLASTDGGFKPAIKAELCVAIDSNSGFEPTLLKGTWKW